jgi:GT2 family glycosyltransferase
MIGQRSETAGEGCPKVAIVILNWNGKEETIECLESVSKIDYPLFEIVVVDNGSTDGSADAIRELFGDIAIIANEENLGYTGGNNVGIRHALTEGFDYVCILNNDTVVDRNFLRLLVDAAEADPKVGIVGPTIYYFDKPNTIWSAGGRIDWSRGLPSLRGLDETDEGQYRETTEVDYVTGSAMLVRLTMANDIGLLDPRFFMYFEEVDWCVRATGAGFKILHVPTARVWHRISVEAQLASPRIAYYMTRNHLLFLKTSQVGIRAWTRAIVRYVRTLGSYTLRPKHRAQRAKRDAIAKGVRDFCRGRWGRAEI